MQATLIPLARSYFPLNCVQADRQNFRISVMSSLIIGHKNTSPFSVYFLILFCFLFSSFPLITIVNKHIILHSNYYKVLHNTKFYSNSSYAKFYSKLMIKNSDFELEKATTRH